MELSSFQAVISYGIKPVLTALINVQYFLSLTTLTMEVFQISIIWGESVLIMAEKGMFHLVMIPVKEKETFITFLSLTIWVWRRCSKYRGVVPCSRREVRRTKRKIKILLYYFRHGKMAKGINPCLSPGMSEIQMECQTEVFLQM